MMLTYIYDGTLDGLLTVLGIALKRGTPPEEIVSASRYQPGFFNREERIETGGEIAGQTLTWLEKKLSGEAMRDMLYAFHSETPGIEMKIYHYIKVLTEQGKGVGRNLGDPNVLALRKISQKVGGEAHRLKGLLRFRKMRDGTFYAAVEPDHHVLPMLAQHFSRRMGKERWVIHDPKRGLAACFDGKHWDIFPFEFNPERKQEFYAPDEMIYEELWKTFFRHIAVEDRKNLNLQRQFMPKKYWKYLVEKE